MRIDDILDEIMGRPGGQSRGAGSDRKAPFSVSKELAEKPVGPRRRRDEDWRLFVLEQAWIKFGLSLERYRMRFKRMQASASRFALRSRGEISSRSHMHAW